RPEAAEGDQRGADEAEQRRVSLLAAGEVGPGLHPSAASTGNGATRGGGGGGCGARVGGMHVVSVPPGEIGGRNRVWIWSADSLVVARGSARPGPGRIPGDAAACADDAVCGEFAGQ